MIKFFAGKDNYESYRAAKKDAETIAQKLGASLRIIDASELSNLGSFIQDLEGIGMFSESSAFLIKRPSENKEIFQYLTDNYQRLKNHEIIFWEDGNPDGRSKLIQILKKDGVLFVYEELKERDLKSWFVNYLKEKQITLSSNQIDFFIQHSELNKNILENEISKIELYLSNQKKDEVTDQELNEILGYSIKGNVWQFLDYFGNRKKKECINEFTKLITFEENTQYLIAMLTRELNIISQILYLQKENMDLRNMKLHPFVLKKSTEKSRKFKWSEVKLFLKKLLDLDFAIKRGDIDEKIGLTLYLLSI